MVLVKREKDLICTLHLRESSAVSGVLRRGRERERVHCATGAVLYYPRGQDGPEIPYSSISSYHLLPGIVIVHRFLVLLLAKPYFRLFDDPSVSADSSSEMIGR